MNMARLQCVDYAKLAGTGRSIGSVRQEARQSCRLPGVACVMRSLMPLTCLPMRSAPTAIAEHFEIHLATIKRMVRSKMLHRENRPRMHSLTPHAISAYR